jgi:hypothetical protein
VEKRTSAPPRRPPIYIRERSSGRSSVRGGGVRGGAAAVRRPTRSRLPGARKAHPRTRSEVRGRSTSIWLGPGTTRPRSQHIHTTSWHQSVPRRCVCVTKAVMVESLTPSSSDVWSLFGASSVRHATTRTKPLRHGPLFSFTSRTRWFHTKAVDGDGGRHTKLPRPGPVVVVPTPNRDSVDAARARRRAGACGARGVFNTFLQKLWGFVAPPRRWLMVG